MADKNSNYDEVLIEFQKLQEQYSKQELLDTFKELHLNALSSNRIKETNGLQSCNTLYFSLHKVLQKLPE